LSLLLTVLIGCSGSSSDVDNNENSNEPSEGDATSPGCDGLTARGECRQGKATYCDLRGDRVRQNDCLALEQKCIIDLARGAVCQELEDDSGGDASACTDTGISESGFCTIAGSAVYCDTTSGFPTTKTWNCPEANMYCSIGECADGAFCCGEPVSEENNAECDEIGFSGTCTDSQSGRYCSGETVNEFSCPVGKTCQSFVCGAGAFCCDAPTGSTNECTVLGIDGVCTEEGHVRYCLGGDNEDIVDYLCDPGEVCQENVCGEGANCCPQ
jgi:hypothetical protein